MTDSCLMSGEEGTRRTPHKRELPIFATPVDFFWFHLRRMAIWLPLATVLFWGLTALWTIEISPAHYLRPTPWGWLFDIYPFVCLCAAAVVCGVRFSGAWLVGKDRKRTGALCMGTPIAEVVRARLWADGIALFGTVCLISIAHECWLFHADNGFLFTVAKSGLSEGYTSPREIVSWAIGVPLLGGAAAWICLGFAYRPMRQIAKLGGIGCLLLAITAQNGRWLSEKAFCPPFEWNLTIIFAVLIALFAAWLCLLVARKAISWKMAAKMCCVWFALIVATYPFGSRIASGKYVDLDEFTMCVSLVSLLLLPHCAAVLDLRRRWRKAGVPDCDTPSTEPLPLHRARIAGLVCGVLLLVWIRWPFEPVACSFAHSRGLPATVPELDAFYPHVDDNENVALKYLAIEQRYLERFQAWIDRLPQENRNHYLLPHWMNDESTEQNGVAQNVRQLSEKLHIDVLTALLVVGSRDARRNVSISADSLCWTRYFWESAGQQTARELHALADSGLTKSRYPLDFSAGYDMRLKHYAQIRDLAQVLEVEAVLAAVDGRSEEAADALHDVFQLMDSLEPEPLLLSHRIRDRFIRDLVVVLESVLGRTCFSDGQILTLQKDLAVVAPSIRKGLACDSLLDLAMAFDLDELRNPVRFLQGKRKVLSGEGVCEKEPTDVPVSVGCDLLGIPRLGALGLPWELARLHEWMRETRLAGTVNLDALEKAGWPFRESCLEDLALSGPFAKKPRPPRPSWRLYFATSLLRFLEPAYRQEVAYRTKFDVAKASLATERFRIEKGTLPERLDALVPDYLDSIPGDPWNPGHPLSYVVKPNGDFVEYSYGSDGEDNGGKEYDEKDGTDSCDITFTVAAQKVVDAAE